MTDRETNGPRVKQRDKTEQFDRHVSGCGEHDPDRGGPGCAAIYSDMRRARKLAITGYVVAGVLAAGAATLFVVSAPRGRSDTAMACGPIVSIVGGSCRLAF
jgi:hypothetical protein